MNLSGIVQFYQPRRTMSSASMNRSIMAPHDARSYCGPPIDALVPQQYQQQQQQQSPLQQNPFSYGPYSAGDSSGLVPAFSSNYIQQRPLPPLVQSEPIQDRTSYHRAQDNQSRGFIEGQHSQHPIVKVESPWNSQRNSPIFANAPLPTKNVTSNPAPVGSETIFGTDVDTLMKTIQAKSQTSEPQPKSSRIKSRPVKNTTARDDKTLKLTREESQDKGRRSEKRYLCTINGCPMTFGQKTHLDIHERKHTGDKPYFCRISGCGTSFSQLGNLKTHERRHTGEKPYKCDLCDKRFAQRGNVRAHRIVHEQRKPYTCRLDDCGKQFTQLGNLKSHHNKFHIATIKILTNKFASLQPGDSLSDEDREAWEYMGDLYKNSNKGIKGRGKDRKIGTKHHSLNSGIRGLEITSAATGGYNNRGNMIVSGVNVMSADPYRMFEGMVDDDSHSHSSIHSGTASSVGTCYSDGPADVYEENVRGASLAFGDRMY